MIIAGSGKGTNKCSATIGRKKRWYYHPLLLLVVLVGVVLIRLRRYQDAIASTIYTTFDSSTIPNPYVVTIQQGSTNTNTTTCTEIPTSNFQRTNFNYIEQQEQQTESNQTREKSKQYHIPLSMFLNIPNSSNNFVYVNNNVGGDFLNQTFYSYIKNTIAVCEFQGGGLSNHPPHALQQIVRCLSFWRTQQVKYQQQSHQSNIFLPVLVWPVKKYKDIKFSYAKSYQRHKLLSQVRFIQRYKQYQRRKKKPISKKEFTIGLLHELVLHGNVLITTNRSIVSDIYNELYRIAKIMSSDTTKSQQQTRYGLLSTIYKSFFSSDQRSYFPAEIRESYNESIGTNKIDHQQQQTLLVSDFSSREKNKFKHTLQEVLPSVTVSMKPDYNNYLYSYAAHTIPSDIHYYSQLIKSKYNYSIHPYTTYKTNKNDIDIRDEKVAPSLPTTTQTETILLPRIGVLNRNRKYFRSILNIDELVIALNDAVNNISLKSSNPHLTGSVHGTNTTTDHHTHLQEQRGRFRYLQQYQSNKSKVDSHVQIMYFENATFQQQMEFFATVDIVITPHGAQSTGLFLMPTCGSIMELFPQGYHIPWFFGSLASISGIQHYSSYISTTGNISYDNENGFGGTPLQRSMSRKQNLCPSIQSVVQYFESTIVQDWNQCITSERNY